MKNKKVNFTITFLITAIILLSIIIFINIIISGISGGRFDLTQDKIYSISSSAKKVLARLKVPINISYYVTSADKMPSRFKDLPRDVVDKLKEFEIASNGMIKFKVYDPTENQDIAEKIAKKGIRWFETQSINKDELALKRIYSALALSYLEKRDEIIPQVTPGNFDNLEYEIISKIFKLTLEKQPKVGIYASLEQLDPQLLQYYLRQTGRMPEPKDMYSNIGEMLQGEDYIPIRTEITKDNPIPEDVDTLLVIQPKQLNERQLYEINKLVQQGKNLIVAVQNYTFNYNQARTGGFAIVPSAVKPQINDFLKNFGVTVDEQIFMDESMGVLNIPTRKNLGGIIISGVAEPIKIPIQISVKPENMNQDVSITNHISGLFYLWGSRLLVDDKFLKENNIKETVLINSSSDCWTIPFKEGDLEEKDFDQKGKEKLGKQPLAILLEGKFPDAFKDKEVPKWPESEKKEGEEEKLEEKPKIETKPAKIMVIGCSEMFKDNFFGSVLNHRLILLNTVDAFSLGDELINIRAKSVSQRYLGEVSNNKKLFYRIFVIGFGPIVLIVIGLIRSFLRRKEKEFYIKAISSK